MVYRTSTFTRSLWRFCITRARLTSDLWITSNLLVSLYQLIGVNQKYPPSDPLGLSFPPFDAHQQSNGAQAHDRSCEMNISLKCFLVGEHCVESEGRPRGLLNTTQAGLFCHSQASIDSGGQLKALGRYLPSGRLTAQGVMWPTWIEERALCPDVGVMVASGPYIVYCLFDLIMTRSYFCRIIAECLLS
jgi:hypothetical protein